MHFTSNKWQFKYEYHLETVKQCKDEPLKEYITCFNNEALDVKDIELNMVL
jgi:hypothetical protein